MVRHPAVAASPNRTQTVAIDYKAVASILPIEARHAVVLGLVLGKTVDDPQVVPGFETIEGAVESGG